MGRVLAPRGVQGQFRVRPHSGSADVLLGCARWFLRLAPTPDQAPALAGAPRAPIVALDVERVDVLGDALCAQTPIINSREGAERLQRAAIFIARSDFPSLPDGQNYWVDLIGLRVVNHGGVDFGTVRELLETGPSQVLVVARDDDPPDAKPRLIPFVDAWVDRVDLAAGQITVGWQPDY